MRTTIEIHGAGLSRFEGYAVCRDFNQFHRKQAEAFQQDLANHGSKHSRKSISPAAIGRGDNE
jgi:hypothetical protein